MKESIIELPNGFEIITWQEDSEVFMGLVNEKGFVLTDRKLSTNEADKLSLTANCP